ncbi:uncharacterized protein LOC114846311 [Betta splendens]|uniref:Uncharacterized protein LOC114846311 n=1 Tax=Betta splendens TaxID=158456 RepID=A0A6P7L933_BETSP|nr:uncharacterized protein LOC114846311 [Betta splendens]
MATCAVICFLIVLGVCHKGLTSLIQTHQTVMAAVGEEAYFSCLLTESKDVLQVTWQKILPDVDKNLTTYNNINKTLDPDFIDKVEFEHIGLQNSSIVIRNLTDEDEGCYRCVFDTYDEGDLSETSCLQVYELHEPILHVRGSNSSEESLVSCSVTARPAPTVTLTVTQQHLYFSHYSTVTVTNANNTLTVTTTVALFGCYGDGTQVGCAVRVPSGPQKEVFMNITEVEPKSTDVFVRKSRSTDPQNKYLMSCGCLAAVIIVLLILRNKKSLSQKIKRLTKPNSEDPPAETQLSLIKQNSEKKKQTEFEEIQQGTSSKTLMTEKEPEDVAANEHTV